MTKTIIAKATAEKFDLGLWDLMSKSHTRRISIPRLISMSLMTELLPLESRGTIAEFYGKAPALVNHAIKTTTLLEEQDPVIGFKIKELRQTLLK